MNDEADDFNGNNETPDMQIDATAYKLIEQYASCNRRSKEINKERKTIRDNAAKLGIVSKAWQDGINQIRFMDPGQRRDYRIGVARVIRIGSTAQAELFPEDAERMRKRKERDAAVKAKATAKAKAKAAKEAGKGPAGAVKEGAAAGDKFLAEQIAANQKAEQIEGGVALSGATMPESQSALAAAKRKEAGLA